MLQVDSTIKHINTHQRTTDASYNAKKLKILFYLALNKRKDEVLEPIAVTIVQTIAYYKDSISMQTAFIIFYPNVKATGSIF